MYVLIIIVAASKSQSTVNDVERDIMVLDEVPAAETSAAELIEDCRQQHKSATLTSSSSHRADEAVDWPDVGNDVEPAADARRPAAGRTEETVTGDVVDGGTAHISPENHLQPLCSDQKMSRGACDILEIIDDSCSSRQRRTDIVSRETVGSLSEVDKVRQSGTFVKLNDDVTLMNAHTDEADHRATAEPGRSLQRASSDAAKIRFKRRKRIQTRLATPGRAGKMTVRHTERAGNCEARTRRAGDGVLKTTAPVTLQKPSPECIGMPTSQCE